MATSERGGEAVAALGIDGGSWEGVVGGEEGEILRKVDFEMVNFRVRISLALILCREIETLIKRIILFIERREIYIEDK